MNTCKLHNWEKVHSRKSKKWKYTASNLIENVNPGKIQNIHNWKGTDFKMYIYDNDRKFTYMKLLEKTPLEKDRTENTHLAKLQKNNNLKNYRKYTVQIEFNF